jgi:hypothetical protein
VLLQYYHQLEDLATFSKTAFTIGNTKNELPSTKILSIALLQSLQTPNTKPTARGKLQIATK